MKIKILFGAIIIAFLSSSILGEDAKVVVSNQTTFIPIFYVNLSGHVNVKKGTEDKPSLKFENRGIGHDNDAKFSPTSKNDYDTVTNFSIDLKRMGITYVGMCFPYTGKSYKLNFKDGNVSITITGNNFTGFYWKMMQGKTKIDSGPC